jgi:hypothetical protein
MASHAPQHFFVAASNETSLHGAELGRGRKGRGSDEGGFFRNVGASRVRTAFAGYRTQVDAREPDVVSTETTKRPAAA